MMLCMPMALILLIALYLVLTRILFPNKIRSNAVTTNYINTEYKSLGPLSVSEKRVMVVFAFTVFLWIFKDIINEAQNLFKL